MKIQRTKKREQGLQRMENNVCSGTVEILDLLTRLMQKPETLPHQRESLV